MHNALKVKCIENVSRYLEGMRGGFPGEERFKQGSNAQGLRGSINY